MRRFMLILGAVATVLPVSMMTLPDTASARTRHHYHARAHGCRYSSGTAGLIAGAGTGAVIGSAAGGGVAGPLIGAVGGAFAGRAIDRSMTARKRCR